jgi:hypothetical protein
MPGMASARNYPQGARFETFVVDHLSDSLYAKLARRGAVGVMRPGFGPMTSYRSAYAELIRGAEVNSRIGGTPPGKPLIGVEKVSEERAAHCRMCIVTELPPRGAPMRNTTLYRVVVVGMGYHGLLTSPTTRIPGDVSIVDIAPTAVGGQRAATGGMSWTPSIAPVLATDRLQTQIHGEEQLKYGALLFVVGLLIALALLGWGAARTAIPAALLANLFVGVLHVTNEISIAVVFAILTVAGALMLARICRNDFVLLGLISLTLLAYVAAFARHPAYAAVTPLGPDQNLRFWGIGDQIGTLLFAPLLTGAVIARHRFGWLGFAAFSLVGLFVMTDNRLGANGGGAIGLGIALAVLGARLSRRGTLALVAGLGVTGTIVLEIVKHGLAEPGPNHLRSAFGKGIQGFIDVAAHRVPLVYAPALHDWPLTLPLAIVLVVSAVLAWRVTRERVGRDLFVALIAGLVSSLLINDATGFMLAAGIGCTSAVARFFPTGAPLRVPVPVFLRRKTLAPSESPPS